MFYPTKAIANYFLQKAFDEGKELNQMKLQRLVYFAHGWYLGINGLPLVHEPVICREYAPVFLSLEDEFEDLGMDCIDRLGTITRLASNKIVNVRMEENLFDGTTESHESVKKFVPTIDSSDITEEQKSEIKNYLDKIWNAYKKYSATKLSNMARIENGPWDRVIKEWEENPPEGTDIPISYLKEYFESKLHQEATS